MSFLKRILGAATIALFLSSPVQANLIKNGSFEDIGAAIALGKMTQGGFKVYGRADTWQIYGDIPHWTASLNVEIWTNDFIVDATDGENTLELNAHPSNGDHFSISQSFDTVIGQTYQLTFFSRKRIKRSNEAFEVSVGDLQEIIRNQDWGV